MLEQYRPRLHSSEPKSASVYDGEDQLVTVHQGHTDKRIRVGFIHWDNYWLTVPYHCRIVDIEQNPAAISEDSGTPFSPRQP